MRLAKQHASHVRVKREGYASGLGARDFLIDVDVLDLKLGADGLIVFEQGTELLFLSRLRVKDRVHGLRKGADDYVGKPYEIAYVVARGRELVRARRKERVAGRKYDPQVWLGSKISRRPKEAGTPAVPGKR